MTSFPCWKCWHLMSFDEDKKQFTKNVLHMVKCSTCGADNFVGPFIAVRVEDSNPFYPKEDN